MRVMLVSLLLHLFCCCYSAYFQDLDSSIYRDETIEELKAMWKNYYPNCPSAMDDVPFALGSVMLACDEYK